MKNQALINLLLEGVEPLPQVWADFGSGEGVFTAALYEILGMGAELYSVERDKKKLRTQELLFQSRYPKASIRFINEDFTLPLELPPLHGILMTNSLRFVQNQERFLMDLQRYLKPKGKVVVVEYDVSERNSWVPFPVPFANLEQLSRAAGYEPAEEKARVDSRYHRQMYCAVLCKKK